MNLGKFRKSGSNNIVVIIHIGIMENKIETTITGYITLGSFWGVGGP